MIDGARELPSIDSRIQEAAQRLRIQTARTMENQRPVVETRMAAEEPTVQFQQPAPSQPERASFEQRPEIAQPAPVMQSPVIQAAALQATANQHMLESAPQAQYDSNLAVEYAPAPMPEPVKSRDIPVIPQIQPDLDYRSQETLRQPRMPTIDDLPRPIQEQISQNTGRNAAPAQVSAETRRIGLLEKLTSLGMGRAAPPPARVEAPRSAAIPQRQAAPSSVHADYAKRAPAAPSLPRATQANLDVNGRTMPHARTQEDDQLEIPAFLRRS